MCTQAAYCVSSQPALNRGSWEQAAQHVARHGAAPQLVGVELNFDLDRLLRAPPSIVAALVVYPLVDTYLKLASAAGRDPLCLYRGLESTCPSRIDGLLIDTRLAALLRPGFQGGTPKSLPPQRPRLGALKST